MLKKSSLKLLVVAVLTLASGSAFSAAANANLAVSASVSQNCTISTTTDLAFGAYDPVGANASTALNVTGNVSVACTKGATGLTIGMDNGLHVSGTQRQMANGAERLLYDLYQPTGGSPTPAGTCPGGTGTLWTSAAPLTLTSPSSKAARAYNVCGTIPAGQDVAAGAYTDTVSATINF